MKQLVLWLAYFDATKSRREGRRVRLDLAVRKPTVEELLAAAKSLGLSAKAMEGSYPRDFWERGRVAVSWEGKKYALLKRVGAEVRKRRAG